MHMQNALHSYICSYVYVCKTQKQFVSFLTQLVCLATTAFDLHYSVLR